MIKFSTRGDWSKTDSFLQRALEVVKLSDLDKYGRRGVDALSAATPKGTGETSKSWYYQIKHTNGGVKLEFLNSSQNQGIPIVILLQYGHGLMQGGFVEGLDFINPAMKPVFDEIAEDAWKELTNV